MKLNLRYNIHHSHVLQRDEFELANLSDHFDSERPAYLYCILSKNRVTINPDQVNFSNNTLTVEFLIQDKNNFIKETVVFEHDYDSLEDVKIIAEFPFNEFKIVDELGNTLYAGKAAYFPEHEEVYGQITNKQLLDYEILYIGQSVLSNNNLPVLQRVSSHSTFQRILEDYNKSHPDKELFSFFFSFKQDAVLDIPESLSDAERISFIENFTRNYYDAHLRERKQNVSLLEAVLINHFKPKYNVFFVDKTPSAIHKAFSGVSQMNLNKVNVIFGIANFGPRFYTDTIERSDTHFIECIIS